jgi:hypothetical protein
MFNLAVAVVSVDSAAASGALVVKEEINEPKSKIFF